MRIRLISCAIAALLLTGCDIIIPPSPPIVPDILTPTDYAWDGMDLARARFLGVLRIDCGTVVSKLQASGHCVPRATPIGRLIHCPLSAPAGQLVFGCVGGDPVPAVYMRLSWQDEAESLRFLEAFGACRVAGAGPAAGEDPRFPTDPGYKVCLFEPYAQLTYPEVFARPAGLYLDFAQSTASLSQLRAWAQDQVFNAPLDLVIDARFLDDEGRSRAFELVFDAFAFYRGQGRQADP